MVKAFFWNRKWALYAYGGMAFLLVSLYTQVHMTVLINTWYGGFYNLLQRAASYKNNPQDGIALFYEKLVSLSYVVNGFEGAPSFVVIVLPYVILAVIT